jgi:murein tripeptide amidase MpaA
MTKRLLILFVVCILLVPRSYSQNIDTDTRLREVVRQYGQAEVTIPYSDNKSLDLLTHKVSILSVRNKIVKISLSPLNVEWFILQKLDYQIDKKPDAKGVISALNMNQAMQWNTYPTYSQYDSIMQSFVALYPSLCHLDTIGTSINGRLVLALKISDNVSVTEDEPEVFYSSTMHGDETGGFILMLRLAEYLLKNYNLNSRVKNLVDNLQIWINPLANPDGAYKNGNKISSVYSSRYNAHGVDLNRNFPDPSYPLVVQQKENVDMIGFMRKHKFVLSANFHSGSELVNYPWDRWLFKYHPDDSWFIKISRAYTDTVQFYSGTGYMIDENNGITRGAVWYVINGGRQDFVTSELQGREVTIELDNQYVTPAAQLPLLWQYNWRSLIGYLENALYGINGHVINNNTSAPVNAEVFIDGHDRDSSQVYSDKTTGSFTRLLYPGYWDLSFSAPGYMDLTVKNIHVINGQKTDTIIRMIPVTSSIDTTNPVNPVLYPNPATTDLKAVLPELLMGPIKIRIISLSGMLISEYNTEAVHGIPVQIDTKRLPSGIYTIVFTNIVTKTYSRGRFIVVK